MSEELWEAAVNFHPTLLGNLGGKAKITYNDLQMNGFNVSHALGTLLKNSDIVGFRSLDEIYESYKSAFAEQFKPISDALKYQGLRHASAVRNLLIHKRGIVDNEFIKQATGLSDIPDWEHGDPPVKFHLTGELCADLSGHCQICAIWLVNAVHSWIIGHPENLRTQSVAVDCGEAAKESSLQTPSW